MVLEHDRVLHKPPEHFLDLLSVTSPANRSAESSPWWCDHCDECERAFGQWKHNRLRLLQTGLRENNDETKFSGRVPILGKK